MTELRREVHFEREGICGYCGLYDKVVEFVQDDGLLKATVDVCYPCFKVLSKKETKERLEE